MNPVRRVIINVQAKFDQLVSRMENHEAMASVAIQELEGVLGEARGQLRRLQLEQSRLATRVESSKEEAARWAERARKVHETDPKDALECVRRMKCAERQAKALAEHQSGQSRLEEQLTRKLTRTEERLVELRGKRNALAVQEASASASEAVARIDGRDGTSVAEAIFDRWEIDLASRESLAGAESDDFAKQFEDQEREEDLQQALNDLIANP